MSGRRAEHLAFLIPTAAGSGAQRVMITLASSAAACGRRVDLVVGHAEGALIRQIGENVNLVALDKSSPLVGRWSAWRADPGGLPVLARPFLFPLTTSDMVNRLPSLVAYLEDSRPDVMLSAKVHTNLVALLARRKASPSTRLIVSERGDYGEKVARSRRWRWRYVTPLMRRLYAEADGIVAVSSDLAARLPGYTGLDPKAIRVLYNPVVSPDLHAAAAAPIDHPWFADGEPPVVLAAGRLEPRKGFRDLIDAFAEACETRPLRLLIFGEGKERAALEQRIATLGLGDHVALPGWTPDLFAYMAKASLFVLSSHYEGLPGVLIQALACGCPVVATDCPTGPREILEDGRYGPLVPIGDVGALKAAMLATLDHPLAPDVLQARSEDFSVDRAVDRYLSLFDHVVGSPMPGGEMDVSGRGAARLAGSVR